MLSRPAARQSGAPPEEGIDAVAQSISKLHIAVPVHMEERNARTQTPLVAYAPPGVDDLDVERIRAFDAPGQYVGSMP